MVHSYLFLAQCSSTLKKRGWFVTIVTSSPPISFDDETNSPHYSSCGPPWPKFHLSPLVSTLARPQHTRPTCSFANPLPILTVVLVWGLITVMTVLFPVAKKSEFMCLMAYFCRTLRLFISWSKRPPRTPRQTILLFSSQTAMARPFSKSLVSCSFERSLISMCVEQQPLTSGSMLSRSPTMARMLAALRCLDRQKRLAAPSQRMICLALATKKSMRVCETSELRMTTASTSVEGSGCTPMRERSRVVSCYVLWNIIIILGDTQESATNRHLTILPLVLPNTPNSYHQNRQDRLVSSGHRLQYNWIAFFVGFEQAQTLEPQLSIKQMKMMQIMHMVVQFEGVDRSLVALPLLHYWFDVLRCSHSNFQCKKGHTSRCPSRSSCFRILQTGSSDM